VTTPKKPARPRRSRTTTTRARKPRATAAPPPEPVLASPPPEPEPHPVVAAEPEPPHEHELPATVDVERIFATHVAPPAPRPHPSPRRAIFFDVENTSRVEHVARVLQHLALDWRSRATELVAVGNWRVVGHETARLLAKAGAQLVHSAPSVGVRDWSDLRIAVAAGAWLATTRPGDSIEIVTDDQAFDAVGDVAASLGVAFRRLSYRALAGMGEIPAEVVEQDRAPRRRRRSGRRGGRSTSSGARHQTPRHEPRRDAPAPSNGRFEQEHAVEPHTAPHDELLNVARELIEASSDRSVGLDALSNALKARGFARTPGSPRLVTRLRRIKELEIGRHGTIRLVSSGDTAEPRDASEPPAPAELEAGGEESASAEPTEPEADPAAPSAAGSGSRRRRRRGGRRRRGRGSHGAVEAPADAPG